MKVSNTMVDPTMQHAATTGSRRQGGRPRRRFPAVVFLFVLLGGLLLSASPASAHRIDQSYIYIDVYDDVIEGRLEFNVDDINDVLDTSIPTDEDDLPAIEAAVDASLDTILDYATSNFDLGTEGELWDVEFRGEYELIGTEAGLFVVLPYDVNETFSAVPETVDVRYEAFVLENENHNGFFHIGNYWEGGVFANESDFLLIFDDDSTFQTHDLDEPDFLKGLVGVVELGIDHIRIGTDHILFVIALLLPAVLVFNTAWEPAHSFKDSLWRVLKIATTFTIAHSITLSLAGFGVIELNAKLVETIIAISIILAALHNFKPIFRNKEWVLAFSFGLFHGLGFAGLLTDLGLDRNNKVWSLFAFNIGVEIGQAAIILLVFPAMFILRRTRLYAIGFKVASVLLAVIAGIWALERIFEEDLKVNELIDPLVEVPRAYLLIALGTGAAWLWRNYEARKGWLSEPSVEAGVAPAHAKADAGADADADTREPVDISG